MAERTTPPEGLRAHLAAPQAEPPWSLTDVGVVLIVLALTMLLISPSVAALIAGTFEPPSTTIFLLAWSVGLALAGAFVTIRWRRTPALRAGLRLEPSRFQLPLLVIVGAGAALTADLIALLGGSAILPIAPLRGLDIGIFSYGVAILFALIMQPLVESVLFWGIILPRLRASFGPYAGLMSSAILYALYYSVVYGSRLSGTDALWYGAIHPLVLGIVFAVLRVYARSTRAAIAAAFGAGLVAVAVTLIGF